MVRQPFEIKQLKNVKKMPFQPKVSCGTHANLDGSGEYQRDGISAIYNRR
jgi:hypothetical protein